MKLRYLLFGDAKHLKNKGQPDEMVADVQPLKDGEKVEKPWIESTSQGLAEYTNSVAPILQKWNETQPYLVDGKEHFIIDGQLKPKKALEKPNA